MLPLRRTTPFTLRRAVPRHSFLPLLRPFHSTPTSLYARKASQDKDSINRESYEYSRSGTDDQTAAESDAAFNPDVTDPQAEQKRAGEGEGGEVWSSFLVARDC